MKPMRYKEIKVIFDPNGKIEQEYQTPRGHVSIHEHEAEWWNQENVVRRTGLKYVLDEEEVKTPVNEEKIPDRIDLEIEADELGIKFNPKIGDANLYKKIQEHKNK